MTDSDDTLYVSAATSEALILAAGFTRGRASLLDGHRYDHGRYIAPTGEKYWVRSEAAQHAIRIILNQQETPA